MFKFLKTVFKVVFFLSLVSGIAAGAGLYYLVVIEPGPEIEESYIESVLGRESVVLYRGGEEKLGVLFEDTHRRYLPYQRIPQDFVKAIVAAEDNEFFNHFGIDLLGIARAMVANIKAGRVVQGGSTLTQQTAKNIFKRESRTIRAKLKELLFALRLEYRYPKEKILEFYANQFFVSGNGHGLGVAARYYFDKDVDELTLLENAFIAGSVKRPNYYNPFTKKNTAAVEKAQNRAKERADYVLGRMLKDGSIDQALYDEARGKEIEFRRGKMAFALNTVVDMVKDALASPVIMEALEDHGISNVSTSGIRIITSIDHDLQMKSVYALRSNLSRLDVRMRGYERETVQKEYNALDYKGDDEVVKGAFVFGRIAGIEDGKGEDLRIQVRFGQNEPEGVIDRQGVESILTAFARWNGQRWSEAQDKDLANLLNQLQEGDQVYVSVRDLTPEGTVLLDLERFPELQGAALVMRKGMIRAMVGGAENRYFNRAVQSRRIMGSTFKTFLFGAALQLGWNSVDMLDNTRNVFVFQGKPYFPRPDHISPYEEVSMSWAGVHSENVAAVWLLYHLLDHLTPPRIRELASRLDMAPRTNGAEVESYTHFRQRIRDNYGIIVNREALQQAAYDQAVLALKADFFFDGRERDWDQLKKLPYGLNFQKFESDIDQEFIRSGYSAKEEKDLLLRRNILRKNYMSLLPTLSVLQQQKRYYGELLNAKQDLFGFSSQDSLPMVPAGIFMEDMQTGKVIFSSWVAPTGSLRVIPQDEMIHRLEQLSDSERTTFWDSVNLEGHVNLYAMEQVQAQMERELISLSSKQQYSEEVLGTIRDYRVMLGLQYLRQLGREVGIVSPLEPVLSFPLGSNVVSLLESVRMYEALVNGRVYSFEQGDGDKSEFEDEDVDEALALIERIETPEGELIYEVEPEAKEVFDLKTRLSVSSIMENTVLYGTGRLARKAVRLTSRDEERRKRIEALDLPIPLLGKTGTANDFINAAFLGIAPGLDEKNQSFLHLENGSTVGVYVGFDDNRPMERRSTHLTGSVGALPTWCSVVQALYENDETGDRIDDVDLSFNGLKLQYLDGGQVYVAVDPEQGGMVLPAGSIVSGERAGYIASILTFGRAGAEGAFEPERNFRPFWHNQ